MTDTTKNSLVDIMPERIWAACRGDKYYKFDMAEADVVEYVRNDLECVLAAVINHLDIIYPRNTHVVDKDDYGQITVNKARRELSKILGWAWMLKSPQPTIEKNNNDD